MPVDDSSDVDDSLRVDDSLHVDDSMPVEPDATSESSRSRPLSGLDESEPRFATTREGRFAWHEEGPHNTTPPLLLLHGFTGHRDDFIGVMPRLARDRRVLAPDLRGHGDSENHAGRLGFSFEQLVNDLAAFLDALEIPQIDLLGHSFGGFIGVRFALEHPERVRSLILMCTSPETPSLMDPSGWRAATEIAEERGMEGLQPLAEGAVRRNPFPGLPAWGDAERYYAHHKRRHVSMTPESYREIGRTFFDSVSMVSKLSEIRQTTRVLVGAQDAEFLPGADLFEEHLPNVRRFTDAGAEHHPHQERPDVFFEEVASHLAVVR